jgi:hypothetical protein
VFTDTLPSGGLQAPAPERQTTTVVASRTMCALDHYLDQQRFVVWRNELRNGKPTKVPYSPNTRREAKADDPRTWGTFYQAMLIASEIRSASVLGPGGFGIELGELGDGTGLGGIDLDTCRSEDGRFAPWAAEVIEQFGSYTEISPSGTGAKVLFKYRMQDLPKIREAMGGAQWGKMFKRKSGSDHPPAIELYIGRRFFAVTFQHLPETPDATHIVDAETVLWILREAGPRFANTVAAPSPAQPTTIVPVNTSIPGNRPSIASGRNLNAAAQAGLHNDNSRSGIAFRMAHEMRREGKTQEEYYDAVRTNPETADWYTEKGTRNKNRELRRAWENAGKEAAGTTVVAPSPPALGAPFTELPHVMDGAVAVEHLNARLFKAADWGGAPCFGRFNADGTVDRLSIENIQVLLSGHFIEVPDGKGGDKRVPAATWWVQCPQKEVFDGVLYDPEGRLTRPGERIRNLYRGHAIEEAKGSWRRMRRHIWKVICRRDPKVFKYLIRWLAHAVQHPGTNPEVMVVLRSTKEGAGKSSLGKWMLKIFGPHGLEATEWEQVFGNFHDDLVNRSFVLLEEPMFPGDHQAAAVLRARLTSGTISINPKGHKKYPITHCIHYMMTTNAQWAIPAGNGARRFLMLDVDESVVGNKQYFIDLWNEANNGGVEAMLYALRRINLDRFNIRDVPKTAALQVQQLMSAPSTTRWAVDAVKAGQLILPLGMTGGSGFGQRVPGSALYAAYQAWCAGQRLRPVSSVEYGRWLGRTGLKSTPTHGRTHYDIPDTQQFAGAVLKEAGII